ncbi:MAG: ABC transporter permease [Hyphomicrobiaceae bacterium]|nr:MAG: ABC transporter permease [Hyphomicrobiaceae bacterium]
MNLVLDIAVTHVRHRARQSLVAVAGVAIGVGFSIMMAALMEGSQNDFMKVLIDALPHITVSDQRRQAPPQPAEAAFAAAEIHGLTPQVLRRGIKNPLAIMAGLEGWVPGAVAPSVKVQALLRYAGRDIAASISGIDPRREPKVSQLATQMRQGDLKALYTAKDAIILGDRLAEKIGARLGANITVQTTEGARVTAHVVGLFHSGVRAADEGNAYVLIKTAQILAQQTGLVNELRVRAADPLSARRIADRIESETGYKSVSWQEANEDLLSALVIRNILMYTIVGAILLVASFGTYNIISTITHEKTRDIAILKSLGLRQATVRRIFLLESLIIGLLGAVIGWGIGFGLTVLLGSVEFKVSAVTEITRLPLAYSLWHYVLAAVVALLSSLLAGLFPARKAARLHPVDIIRGAT